MSLTTVLDRLQALALTLSGEWGALTPQSCMVDDWTALDARGTNVACVIQQADASRYGPEVATAWAGAYGTQGDTAALHTCSLTVAVRRGQGQGGDAAALATLHTLADALVARLISQPTLGGLDGVEGAQVVSVGRPGQLLRPPGQGGQGGQAVGAAVAKVITVQVLESL